MADIENNPNPDPEGGLEEKPSKIKMILVALIVIIIWLAILALLIKFDVGGFGSSVLKPIFKDVPIISAILPDTEDEETYSSYEYKSLAEAIDRIKELEVELQTAYAQIEADEETIAELQAEVARLEAFEKEQEAFYEIQQQWYDEVVFSDDAIDYEYYKTYYEEIEPEYAKVLYQQVVQKYLYDEAYQELSDTFASMDAGDAANVIYEMTGDLDIVIQILQGMDLKTRGEILAELSSIDAVFAAKIAVLLAPEEG